MILTFIAGALLILSIVAWAITRLAGWGAVTLFLAIATATLVFHLPWWMWIVAVIAATLVLLFAIYGWNWAVLLAALVTVGGLVFAVAPPLSQWFEQDITADSTPTAEATAEPTEDSTEEPTEEATDDPIDVFNVVKAALFSPLATPMCESDFVQRPYDRSQETNPLWTQFIEGGVDPALNPEEKLAFYLDEMPHHAETLHAYLVNTFPDYAESGLTAADLVTSGEGCLNEEGQEWFEDLERTWTATGVILDNVNVPTSWSNSGLPNGQQTVSQGIVGPTSAMQLTLPNGSVITLMDRCGNLAYPAPPPGIPVGPTDNDIHEPPPVTPDNPVTPVCPPGYTGTPPNCLIVKRPEVFLDTPVQHTPAPAPSPVQAETVAPTGPTTVDNSTGVVSPAAPLDPVVAPGAPDPVNVAPGATPAPAPAPSPAPPPPVVAPAPPPEDPGTEITEPVAPPP